MTRAAVWLVAVAALVGCAEGDPGADGDVESLGELVNGPVAQELTTSGSCTDGRLWAADDAGSLVVVIDLADDADADEVVLPSDEVAVTVLHGDGLRDPCAGDVEPAASSPGVRGRVRLGRDGSGCVAGFEVDGLEAEDGTTFGPIEGDATAC